MACENVTLPVIVTSDRPHHTCYSSSLFLNQSPTLLRAPTFFCLHTEYRGTQQVCEDLTVEVTMRIHTCWRKFSVAPTETKSESA